VPKVQEESIFSYGLLSIMTNWGPDITVAEVFRSIVLNLQALRELYA